jgi:uncharacterized protein (TIGR02300 family)
LTAIGGVVILAPELTPAPKVVVMPLDKTKLGTRFTCFSCGTRFYDLNRPVATCPECGADQAEAPQTDVKAMVSRSKKKAAKQPDPKRKKAFDDDDSDDDDDVDVDSDDDDLDDLDDLDGDDDDDLDLDDDDDDDDDDE